MVAAELRDRGISGGSLYDIGCGVGRLEGFVRPHVTQYVGVDVVAYKGFPTEAPFLKANLDEVPWPIAKEVADVVASVETIEHLENPRLHGRQLARLAKPGALVIVTTPNNLSWSSILTLIGKGTFNAFQDVSYPAHLTALVATDLLRIAKESGLLNTRIRYSNRGRIPFTPRHWPKPFGGQRFSDNVLMSGLKPAS
jgi:SAM-dependent methyltransferase